MQQTHGGLIRLLLVQQYSMYLQSLNNDKAGDDTEETEPERASVIRCKAQLE